LLSIINLALTLDSADPTRSLNRALSIALSRSRSLYRSLPVAFVLFAAFEREMAAVAAVLAHKRIADKRLEKRREKEDSHAFVKQILKKYDTSKSGCSLDLSA